MRLASARVGGANRLVVARDGTDLRLAPAPLLDMPSLLDAGDDGLDLLRAVPTERFEPVRDTDMRLVAPVPKPGKVVAVGLNYVDHAAEGDMQLPSEPLLFSKLPNAVIGPCAPITWRRADTQAVDFEAELAAVIGRRATKVQEADALSYVLGYTCLNDVSARDLQFADGQWVRGKSLDSFCPMGPWIVTSDEIGDPQALRVRCIVNGEVLQDAPTSDMVFSVAALIAYITRFMTLDPGDVVATGTPPGVGWFRSPRRILDNGDEVTVDIDAIGSLTNTCRAS